MISRHSACIKAMSQFLIVRPMRKISQPVIACNTININNSNNTIHQRFISFDCSSHNSANEEDDIVHLEDNNGIVIPLYPERPNEQLNVRKQRLMYQSRKRGMLENDLLLSTFADKYLKSMSVEQTKQYDTLINKPSNDWDIYYWATNKKPTPTEYENEIMTMLREHVRNDLKEKRLQMPALKDN